MIISQTKTTCTLFTKDPKEVNGKARPNLTIGDVPVAYDPEPKLLGVFFDSQLTFHRQSMEVKKKLQSRLKILRCLTGRSWGCHGDILRLMYKTYCEPVALYCCSSWLSMTSTSNQNRVEVEHRKAAKIITGCTATSPNLAVLREADLVPLTLTAKARATILRESILRRPFNHLAKVLCTTHIRPRIKAHGGNGAFIQSWRDIAKASALEAGLEAFQRDPISITSIYPPWQPAPNITINTNIDVPIKKEDPDYIRKTAAMAYLETLPNATTSVWTDGSATESNKNGGSGVWIQYSNSTTQSLSCPAGAITSSLRAEMVAIKKAADTLLASDTPLGPEVRLCTDSRSSLQKLLNFRGQPRDKTTEDTWDALVSLSTRSHITLQWVPSHCGIFGNERADHLANLGAREPQDASPIDLTTAKTCIQRLTKSSSHHHYLQDHHTIHHQLCSNGGTPLTTGNFTRREEICLHQLRVGHSPLSNSYLARITPGADGSCPRCLSDDDSIPHLLLLCPATLPHRTYFFGPAPDLSVLHSSPTKVRDYLLAVGLLTRPPD